MYSYSSIVYAIWLLFVEKLRVKKAKWVIF